MNEENMEEKINDKNSDENDNEILISFIDENNNKISENFSTTIDSISNKATNKTQINKKKKNKSNPQYNNNPKHRKKILLPNFRKNMSNNYNNLSKITELSEESRVYHSSLNNNIDDINSKKEYISTFNSQPNKKFLLEKIFILDDDEEIESHEKIIIDYTSNGSKQDKILKNKASFLNSESKIKISHNTNNSSNKIPQHFIDKHKNKCDGVITKKYNNIGKIKYNLYQLPDEDDVSENIISEEASCANKNKNGEYPANDDIDSIKYILKKLDLEDIDMDIENYSSEKLDIKKKKRKSKYDCIKEKKITVIIEDFQKKAERKNNNDLWKIFSVSSFLIFAVSLILTLSLLLGDLGKNIETSHVSLEEYNNNYFLLLSKLKVACDDKEFLISFSLKKDNDNNYFYKYTCIKPDFAYLINNDIKVFSDINPPKKADITFTNSTNKTITDKSASGSNTDSSTNNMNVYETNTTNNESEYNNPNSTLTFHVDDKNNSELDEEEEGEKQPPALGDVESSGSSINPDKNQKQKNVQQDYLAGLVSLKLSEENSLLCISNSIKLSEDEILINSALNRNITDVKIILAINTSIHCEYELSNYINNITNIKTNETEAKGILFIENTWYKTPNISLGNSMTENINYLTKVELICEQNFALAEFFLVYDEYSNSFTYLYRCSGSRKKNLDFECKNKLSNRLTGEKEIDSLVDLKIEAGKYYQFLRSFKFVQDIGSNYTNHYEYNLCQIENL